MTNITFTACSPALQKQANKFYKKFKTNVSCNRNDSVFCALNSEKEVIAVTFIRQIETTNEFLLRSLYVDPKYRSLGIARELCKMALLQHKSSCFTLCEPELMDFYGSLGFTPSEAEFDSANINKQIKKGLRLLRRP